MTHDQNPEVSETTAGETDLERDIGLVGAISIGVGTMIAGGIFVLSGLAVSNIGAAAIVSFVLAAVVAGFTALTYAEFATIYTVDGGGYEYVVRVFESDWSYLVGWLMILGYPASAAFYLASFSDWFARFLYPVFGVPSGLPYWIPGLVVLAVLVAVNLGGAEESGWFQVVVTGLKVALIGLFLWGGLRSFEAGVVAESMAENVVRFDRVVLTSTLVFITFFGFEAIATSEGEIRDPERTVPRAIFASIGFVTVLYVLVVVVVVLAINDPGFLRFLVAETELASTAAAGEFVATRGEVAMGRAAQYYLGPAGFYAFVGGALLSMVSAANATILAGSRVKFAMARHDHLPGRYRRVHSSLGVPHYAVLLTGSLILLFVVVFTVAFGSGPGAVAENPLGVELGLGAVAHFADFTLLGGLAVVNVALVQSRRTEPDRSRGFRVPGVPWVPMLAVASNLFLLVSVERESLLLGLVAVLVGVVVRFAVVE